MSNSKKHRKTSTTNTTQVNYEYDKYTIELVDLENAEWMTTDQEGYVFTEVYVAGKSWRVYAECNELDNGEFEYSIIEYEYLDEHPRN
jgi:hypothetical protein